MTVYTDPVNDEIETCLVRAITCLRGFVGDYLLSRAINRDPVSFTPDEFEQVADDMQVLIEAKRLGVWKPEMHDYDCATGEFLDAALAEFIRREEDAIGC